MAGYKRVNFYELCRLCASNQQKEKTHIFEEEGRKIQLQTKIQTCLSLKVCENDYLPKVVCAQCLRTLEECYSFRSECVNSESMLSSYFNNFRYTEDFKKSGKVYIKDTCTKPAVQIQDQAIMVSSSTNTANLNIPTTTNQSKPLQDPLYLVQTLPIQEKIPKPVEPPKITQTPTQLNQNYNIVNQANQQIKCVVKQEQSTVNNITVNSHGEIINLGSISDIEALIAQNMVQKLKHTKPQVNITNPKRSKYPQEKNQDIMLDNSVIHIDLTASEVNNQNNYEQNLKFEKLPHIKTTTDNKFMYTIKIEDSSKQTYNQGIVLNQINNIPGQYQPFQATQISNNNSINASSIPNVNYVTSNTNSISSSASKVEITSNIKLESPNNKMEAILPHHINEAYNINEHKSQNMIVVSQHNSSNVVRGNVVPHSTVSGSSLPIPSTVNMSNFMNLAYSNQSSVNTSTTVGVGNANEEVAVNVDPLGENLNQPIQQATSSSGNANAASQNPGHHVSRVHICDICQKIFKRREHLNQHLKLHTGFRPFVCESCNKSFMRKEHLLRHMTSHSGQKNYTCNICDKSFSRNDNLLKHKKTHDKQGKYTCEYCQKTFVMKHYYHAHKITHEPEQKCVWNVVKV